ncbi:hypothetical protein COLO4_00894 [Corchorus olitorius]|uniref:Uncharacterized protein n=1 Tax=Corchorus olitorius TaxID=93759 RepID=A0A1R3L390_9ROSI|nr:hypothetical protein COLO4_00894 [Corchorus olitorius]
MEIALPVCGHARAVPAGSGCIAHAEERSAVPRRPRAAAAPGLPAHPENRGRIQTPRDHVGPQIGSIRLSASRGER